MRICIVAEGCYPYVVGGVSSWIHGLIQSFPEQEFVILSIVATRSQRGKFVYELPQNVTEVHELYLEDVDWERGKRQKISLGKNEYRALRGLLLNENVEWNILFELFQERKFSVDKLLMGPDFLHAAMECYKEQYSQIVFSDFLWTLRSIYLPLFLTLKMELPKADLYHCLATGYGGVLGSMAKQKYNCSLLISEHGIYTREREEELIKADWVEGIYKNIWISQFKKMSALAYERADQVTSLYAHARELQLELGCPAEKTMIVPNGIALETFANLPGKGEAEKDSINLGAVLRVTPIKDVKTMIQAFAYAKKKKPKLKLWIMGPWEEDKAYAEECFEMVDVLQVQDVIFTGQVDVREHLGRMDMTILTSISEGQPLTILESFAARKPVIATDVGNCRSLIYGEEDEFGPAGIVTHVMHIEEIAQAIIEMAADASMRTQMGENGYARVAAKYQRRHVKETYQEMYRRMEK